jgi:hypothetical protein
MRVDREPEQVQSRVEGVLPDGLVPLGQVTHLPRVQMIDDDPG